MIGIKRGAGAIAQARKSVQELFVWVFALSIAGAPPANADELAYALEIPAQDLDGALKTLAVETDKQVLFAASDVKGHTSPEISGEYSTFDAMELLLADTGLVYEVTRSDVLLVKSNDETVGIGEPYDQGGDSDSKNSSPAPVLMAQNQTSTSQTSLSQQSPQSEDEPDAPFVMDEIIVTGTNIRGLATQPSPTIVIDRDDIDAAGIVTTQDLLRTIPQNLPSEGGVLGGAGEVIHGGAAINLRGLGSASTLVLVNGRRISPGSNTQRVDVSLIPLSAVERVEVLTDGASAIYGSDAIAGVINFILNDGFDGAETRLRFGTVTDGNLEEYQASQAIGRSWETGSIFGNYEYYRRNSLATSDRSFAEQVPSPSDLLPQTKRHSFYLTGKQSLNNVIELFGDFTHSEAVTDSVQSQELVGAIRTDLTDTESKQLGATLGLNFTLLHDWQGEVYGGYSANEVENDIFVDGSLTSDGSFDFSIRMFEGRIDGPLFSLPGGQAKLALGGQFRTEQFENSIDFLGSPSGIDVDRDITAAYGEVFLPIIGESNALPFARALELTAAVRYEDYSDFGSSTNPKFGIRLAPTESLSLRGSFGTSFRAPEFQQLNNPMLVVAVPGAFFVPPPGETAAPSIVQVGGGNPNLGPEESEAWTLGADYRIEGPINLDVSLTYYDISFTDRISDPLNGSIFAVFADPDVLGSFFNTNPSISEVEALFASEMFFNFFDVQPAEIGGIANQNLQNIAVTEQQGIDWSATIQTETAFGQLTAGISGNYIIDFTDQLTPTTDPVEIVDTLANPVDLRFRANLGLATDGANAYLFLNYTDGFTSRATGTEQDVSSWTTVDVNVNWQLDHYFDSPVFEKATLGLTAQNILDQDPPFVDRAGASAPAFFDGTNANPLGRFVAIQLKKRF